MTGNDVGNMWNNADQMIFFGSMDTWDFFGFGDTTNFEYFIVPVILIATAFLIFRIFRKIARGV